MYLEKEREQAVVDLHKQLIESGVGLDKLTLIKLDYDYRVRYEKDEQGNVISKIMDRGFIGLQGNKVGLDSDDVFTCFIYGKRTVGAVIKENKLLLNSNLRQSADFNVLMLNLCNEKGLVIDWVDHLPTGEVVRKAKTEKTLDDCIKNAKTVENLNCDLGF